MDIQIKLDEDHSGIDRAEDPVAEVLVHQSVLSGEVALRIGSCQPQGVAWASLTPEEATVLAHALLQAAGLAAQGRSKPGR